MAPTLLLTRPTEASDRFAAQVRACLGDAIKVVVAPLIAPRFLDPDLPQVILSGRARGLLFTSETGVAGFARISADRSLPAYCVGTRTAQAATEAGFRACALGGDADRMVAALQAMAPAAPLVHARGVDARGDLAARLTASGLPTQEIVVYDQREQPLSAFALALLAGSAPVVVPLFSPRTAALFAAVATGARAPLHLAAISAAAAEPLKGMGAALRIAAEPTAESMLAAVLTLWRDIPAA